MINTLSLSSLQARFGGELVNGDVQFFSVSTNTRELSEKDLFIALKGERFDAHNFLDSAQISGACGLVVEQVDVTISLPQWVVKDTTLALGDIARAQRDQFTGKVVAVTGSSGKTTVKGMIFSVFQIAYGEQAFATKGNLNNHIGVPLTMLSLEKSHQYAVIEMGASSLKEIDYLTHIAKPDVAMVNNVMAAHVEGFGSIDNIATAKGEIYEGLQENGAAVINLDDVYAPQWLEQNYQRQIITYGLHESHHPYPHIQAKNVEHNTDGCASFQLCISEKEYPVHLCVLGMHNVANALAATACAYGLGLSSGENLTSDVITGDVIAKGLANFTGTAGRLERMDGMNGSVVIDDSYNANPRSVCAAIDVLADVPAKKILILGDMAELGDETLQAHQDIGLYSRDKNIDYLLTVGKYTKAASDHFSMNNFHFDHIDQLIDAAKVMADNHTVFLIKGSRSSRMDRVVEALKQRGEDDASLVS